MRVNCLLHYYKNNTISRPHSLRSYVTHGKTHEDYNLRGSITMHLVNHAHTEIRVATFFKCFIKQSLPTSNATELPDTATKEINSAVKKVLEERNRASGRKRRYTHFTPEARLKIAKYTVTVHVCMCLLALIKQALLFQWLNFGWFASFFIYFSAIISPITVWWIPSELRVPSRNECFGERW